MIERYRKEELSISSMQGNMKLLAAVAKPTAVSWGKLQCIFYLANPSPFYMFVQRVHLT